MKTVERILLPVDFSDCSEQAAATAVTLAGKSGASIDVMTVVESAALLMGEGLVMPAEAISEMCNAADAKLADFARRHLGGVLGVRHFVRDGHVAREILAAAGFTRADVIVMGTHGRGGLGHLLMGSVAEKIVRKSTVPVVTVVKSDAGAPKAIRRLLVPTDFSDCSAAAADAAARLAADHGAEITVLAAVDTSPLRELYGDPNYLNERLALVLARARENVNKFARDRFPEPAPACDVAEGKAVNEILAAARRTGADLIVMGTHGRGAISHLLLGSVAEKVLRRSPVPVMTVRAGGPEAHASVAGSRAAG